MQQFSAQKIKGRRHRTSEGWKKLSRAAGGSRDGCLMPRLRTRPKENGRFQGSYTGL